MSSNRLDETLATPAPDSETVMGLEAQNCSPTATAQGTSIASSSTHPHDHGLSNEEVSILQLPSDFAKTPATCYQPGYHSFVFSEDWNRSPISENQTEPIDEKSLILTAFKVLLARYTQQETIAVGVNLVDIHADAIHIKASSQTCSQIVIEQSAQTLMQQSSAILEQDAAAGQTGLARSQCPVALTFLSGDCPFETPDHGITWLQNHSHEFDDDADLHLVVVPSEQGAAGIWLYNANLFSPETVQRLCGHFQTVLTGIQQSPACSISQLPLLTAAEQHQLLVEWRGATADYPQVPVYRTIESFAQETPEAIALRFQDQSLTYAALNERANQLAHYLNHLGVAAGDRVAVFIQPCLEIGTALLGIFKAGGVYVPLDPTHPAERLAVILEDTQAKVILTQSSLLPHLPESTAHVICFDQSEETIRASPAHPLQNGVDLDQTAYIIYTSGTTGKPKGVMASHRNLINYILATQEKLGFNQQDVIPAIARFTFSISLFELLSPLVAGGTLVVLEREHILDFPRLAETLEQLTMLHTVPSLMRRLVNYIQEQGLDIQKFHKVKHVFTGGDIVPADLLEDLKKAFANASVGVLYGCSEVSSLCATFPVPRDQTIAKSRVGKPFNNVVIRLYDAQQNLVPIGVPGEIYVGGAGVTQGYLNRAELTQEKFVAIDGHKFYRTGDLGRFGADGNLEFLGRADFQIKLRGIRIELGDIESMLRRLPGVKDGVVAAHDLGSGEKSLVAYIVLDAGLVGDQPQTAVIGEIREFLATQLPGYMLPAAYIVLEAMPLNANQKVDRRALPLPSPENLAGSRPFLAPRNAVEQQLADLWQATLGIQRISVQDNFFELGGDSLLAVALVTQIEAKLGKKLPVSAFVTAPTIAQLAASLSSTQELEIQNSLVLLREGGSEPPIFFIHDGDGEILLYRNLAHCLKPGHPVYGIQPYSSKGHSVLHTRFTDMAAYYVKQIRAIQPEGPYFLNGLCVGGILAFEMALQLQQQGQTIGMVGLIDAADVAAAKRSGVIASRRLNSLSQSFGKHQHLDRKQRLLRGMLALAKKSRNVLAYEVESRINQTSNTLKVKLLRHCLDRGMKLPECLQPLSPRTVFQFAGKDYIPQKQYQGEVLLFRATQKSDAFAGTLIDDTPYSELFSDPLLGWEQRVTNGVKAYDIPGGHSSMLQQPNVQVMAETMQAYIDAAINAAIAHPSHQLVKEQSEDASENAIGEGEIEYSLAS
ncbi:amino acid adenylation domain-containing protein [Leptolyngbya sp. GB1-A1]|uniref:non-ribosomal peptide synthetase n=1 Tax=Leptolyngbya sp. GB1-A1 TaxID=2933908 RepID=UPI003299AAA0